MKKDRIVFFASGDFAIDTFETMLYNGSNIVGLVTSNDNVKFHNKTISQVAKDYGVPFYTIKDKMEDDKFLIDWLKRIDGDIFCVISFKKLPKNIIKMAKKCAFNVHASLLPLLRGAAPINWAIRLGYKDTGLTAFVLSDQIDCGDIIANTKVKIATGAKYSTLYKKLSDECVDLTTFVIDDVLQRDNWEKYLIKQPTIDKDFVFIQKAKKINSEYYKCHWTNFNAQNFKNLVDSVDDTGFNCTIVSVEKENKLNIKTFNVKIFDVDVVEDKDYKGDTICETDGKTYIKIHLLDETAALIKKIQLEGKKVMDVKSFLNGFNYFRDENYITYITDL